MIDGDEYVNGEAVTWRHPIDDFEPEEKHTDLVRDARMAAVFLLNDFALAMLNALARNNDAREGLITLYGISYAMGLNICGETSQSARADSLGIERATLSKIGCAWNASHDLKPSFYQKTEGAGQRYADSRRAVVRANNVELMPPHQKAKPFKTPPPLPK